MELVTQLREKGLPAYFTIDAGPNVKIVTLEPHGNAITSVLKQTVPEAIIKTTRI